MGRLSDKFNNFLPDKEQQYDEYEDIRTEEPIPEPQEEPEPEEQPRETSYEDVPIKIARDIKKRPTPKGYFRTTLFGIPVDLHCLEDYIVKTSPFAIKTLMRFDNARNIEEIKQYSTKTTGKKKLDGKFFLMIGVAIIVLCLGAVMLLKGPEIMQFFKFGMGP